MGIVATDVKTEFGVYINSGQGIQHLRNAFMRPESSLLKVFKSVPTQNEVERSALITHSRVAQAFKRKWSPAGDITFTPHSIPLFKFKLDVECYPDDLETTWLAFLADKDSIERAKWPFVRWYIEKQLLAQYEEDLEMNERFAGVYAAPTDNTTAANAGTGMNGIDHILATHVDDGLITPYATGALSATAATFRGQIEAFVKSIDPKIRKFVKYVNVPKEKEDLWLAAQRAAYQGNWDALAAVGGQYKVIDTNVMVNFVEAMDGSDVIFATVEDNAVRFVKRSPSQPPLVTDVKDIRLVQFSTDHWEGLGFHVPQFVFCNDQTMTLA